jgi:acid phosphatase family membrane protein YuiD
MAARSEPAPLSLVFATVIVLPNADDARAVRHSRGTVAKVWINVLIASLLQY